jgi:hypothetical protein
MSWVAAENSSITSAASLVGDCETGYIVTNWWSAYGNTNFVKYTQQRMSHWDAA